MSDEGRTSFEGLIHLMQRPLDTSLNLIFTVLFKYYLQFSLLLIMHPTVF